MDHTRTDEADTQRVSRFCRYAVLFITSSFSSSNDVSATGLSKVIMPCWSRLTRVHVSSTWEYLCAYYNTCVNRCCQAICTSGRACELLLDRPPLEAKSESLARMRGEVPSRSGNLRGASAMNEGNGQIAQRRHNLRSRAGAQAGTVFAKGDVAHIKKRLKGPLAGDGPMR